MTAIITYFDEQKKHAIIACDRVVHLGSEYCEMDKGWFLFDRFFVAVYGPSILPISVEVLDRVDDLPTTPRPSNADELVSLLFALYEVYMPLIRSRASAAYQESKKPQAAIIYDQDNHQMLFAHFGWPFNDNLPQERPHLALPAAKLEYYGLFEGEYEQPEFLESEFLGDPQAYIENQFAELDEMLEMRSNPANNRLREKVGKIGTYYCRYGDHISLTWVRDTDQLNPASI